MAGLGFLRKLGLTVTIATTTTPVVTSVSMTIAHTTYLRAFPIVGTKATPYSPALYPYADVFGTPASEGPIQGADLPAARGTRVVAVCEAEVISVTRAATGLGGIWIWLQDVTGTRYYYAHLIRVGTGIGPGMELTTGQTIGAVGNSGDACSGAPYLYLEAHPGGGTAIDPCSDLNLFDPTPSKA